MRMALGHSPKSEASMSEIKKAGDALKDVKRLRARFGAGADRLIGKIASLDAAAAKVEATADSVDTEEKEITALLTELGSNFPEDEAVAPAKKGIFGK